MFKKSKKQIVNVIMATALIACCLSGCGESAPQTQEILGAPVSVMEENVKETIMMQEAVLEQHSEAEKTKSIEKDKVTKIETIKKENQHKDMEDMIAKDIVKEMRIGWNLGNTFDAWRDDLKISDLPYRFETAWGNPETTQELIDTVIDQGFNVIRIPVTWKNHIGEAPEYVIEEQWMQRVKEVVDYAYNRGVYVIINTHHEDWNEPYYDNEEAAAAIMRAVWTQIGEVFQDYDEHLIFESQNEPRKIGTSVEWTGGDAEGWEVVNRLNQVFIDTVRNSGGSNPYRMLMIPGYAANCWESMKHIKVPENDKHIIVSVHAYEPYDFALKLLGRSEWNQDTYNIDTIMGNIKTLFLDKDIPVIIGEFAAMSRNNEEERAAWAGYYVSKAREIGVPCLWWDNGLFEGDGELLGLFDRITYECVYPKLLKALQQATQ
ncbi:MAG: glycoside hydrolase family 5 protein [Lachnospiraceae bacterium]|nr:glycoside hydrolase family 5 protein [Lachnospiraceae bacterium]